MTEITRDPMVVLDAADRVRTASRAFHQVFGISPEEAKDRTIHDLNHEHWDDRRLRDLLGQLLVRSGRVEDFELALDDPQAGRIGWRVNAIAIGASQDASRIVLLGFAPAGQAPDRN